MFPPLPFVIESAVRVLPSHFVQGPVIQSGAHKWWGHVPGAAMRADFGPLRRTQVTLSGVRIYNLDAVRRSISNCQRWEDLWVFRMKLEFRLKRKLSNPHCRYPAPQHGSPFLEGGIRGQGCRIKLCSSAPRSCEMQPIDHISSLSLPLLLKLFSALSFLISQGNCCRHPPYLFLPCPWLSHGTSTLKNQTNRTNINVTAA